MMHCTAWINCFTMLGSTKVFISMTKSFISTSGIDIDFDRISSHYNAFIHQQQHIALLGFTPVPHFLFACFFVCLIDFFGSTLPPYPYLSAVCCPWFAYVESLALIFALICWLFCRHLHSVIPPPLFIAGPSLAMGQPVAADYFDTGAWLPATIVAIRKRSKHRVALNHTTELYTVQYAHAEEESDVPRWRIWVKEGPLMAIKQRKAKYVPRKRSRAEATGATSRPKAKFRTSAKKSACNNLPESAPQFIVSPNSAGTCNATAATSSKQRSLSSLSLNHRVDEPSSWSKNHFFTFHPLWCSSNAPDLSTWASKRDILRYDYLVSLSQNF